MKLEKILQKIVDNKNICKQFLELTSTEDVYKFLCEKYDYEDDFKTFCEIVEKSKNEFLRISKDENFDKVSGGKSYKEYLKSIGITGLSGIMAFSGLGSQEQSKAYTSASEKDHVFIKNRVKTSRDWKVLNPVDAKALAVGLPVGLLSGGAALYLASKALKYVFSGNESNVNSVPKFTGVTLGKDCLYFDSSELAINKLNSQPLALFDMMKEKYNNLSETNTNISEYGQTFWRQWYATLYVCVRMNLGNRHVKIDTLIQEAQGITNIVGEMVSQENTTESCGIKLDKALKHVTSILSKTSDLKTVNSLFSNTGNHDQPSLISSICQNDTRLSQKNLLALKTAIDQDWKNIKELSCNDFLNCAGAYESELNIE